MIDQWCTGKILDLAWDVFEDFEREGIIDALERSKGSREFLRSKVVAVGVAITIVTIVGAVLALFGVTAATFQATISVVVLHLVLAGFATALIVTAFSIRRIL